MPNIISSFTIRNTAAEMKNLCERGYTRELFINFIELLKYNDDSGVGTKLAECFDIEKITKVIFEEE